MTNRDKLMQKCKEEIKWAQENINEMNAIGGYCDEDKIYLPCWLKAHQEILALMEPKFPVTHCSQCGESFGPGDHGYSHCDDHKIL